jgi:hypothetical protein
MLSYRSSNRRALVGVAMFLALWGVSGQGAVARAPGAGGSPATTVRTGEELARALRASRTGGKILLAPGYYGQQRIEGVQIADGQLVVASADPKRPAIIEFLNIRNSRGLTFRELEVGMEAGGGQGIRVTASANIRLENLDIHGVLDGDPTSDGTGVLFEKSTDVAIIGSKLHDLTSGVGHNSTNGLTISDNDFRLLRVDGIAGTDSNDVLISGNRFTDFYPLPADHADVVQFWQTSGNPTINITVTDNIFVRGAGAKVQGIFMTASTGGYQNMVISGNAIVGGMYHGITVAKVSKLEISDNLVLGYQDLISWILVQDCSDAVLANNQSTAITVKGPEVQKRGNVVLKQAKVGDMNGLQRWRDRPQLAARAR